MPREISTYVYRFNELSDEAKDNVRYRYAEDGWFRDTEYMSSLDALVHHFGCTMKDYSIDWTGGSYSSVKFSCPDDYDYVSGAPVSYDYVDDDGEVDDVKLAEHKIDEIRRRLDQLGSYDPVTLKGHGDCKLTGMCYDESAIDGFRKAFVEGETDLDALLHAAFDSLRDAAEKDYAYDISDEALAEDAEANDSWFYEDGKRAPAPDVQKGRYRAQTLSFVSPHGRCVPDKVCVEHAIDKSVPSCVQKKRRK